MLRIVIDLRISIHAGSTIFPIGLWWFDLYQQKPEFSTGYKVIDLRQIIAGHGWVDSLKIPGVFSRVEWLIWSSNDHVREVGCLHLKKAHHDSCTPVKYPCKNNGNKLKTVYFD